MLGWVVLFLIIALVAGIFGFTNISVAAMGIAKIIFFIFIILFLASIVLMLFR